MGRPPQPAVLQRRVIEQKRAGECRERNDERRQKQPVAVLLREGLASLLERFGFEIAGQAGDGVELLALVRSIEPELAIIDIRMPPTHTNEGLDAAPPSRAKPARAARGDMPAKPTGMKKDVGGPVDVNRADAEELQHLPGVGPVTAGRIIEARKTNPFKSVDDLRRVPGIGPKTLDKPRPHVTVGRVKDDPTK